MTPALQLRWDALAPERQAAVFPMLEDLLTTLEHEGAAVLVADPEADGRAAILALGDVHFVYQLLRAGMDAYAGMLKPTGRPQ